MWSEVTRREFLKKTGVLATALALSGCGGRTTEERLIPYLRTPEEQVAGNFTFFASTCRECPAGCGVLVRTMNGRANKLEGNPQHPVSQGRLCARGQAGLQALYNPDRVEGPGSRIGGRDLDFTPMGWDEGIATLAQALEQAGNRVGVVAGFVPDHLYGVLSRLLEAVGADPPVVWNLYRAAEGRSLLLDAAEEILGERRLPLLDIGASDGIASFGANFLETWLSPVAYSRGYADMRTGRRRGTLVQIEPRFSMTAASADVWLPVAGGREGDAALMMGRIILDEGLGSPDRPAGIEAVFQDVRPRDLAEELELDFEQVVEATRAFAGGEAPLAIPGGGLSAYPNGPAAIRAVLALDLLVGAANRTLSLSPQVPGDGLGDLEQVSTYADVRRLVERMDAGEVDVLLVLDGDPLHDFPQVLGFEEAAAQVDLIVDMSPFPTDTNVLLADLRLPGHTYLESWGFDVPEPGTSLPTLSAQQPVVQPVHDTRSPVDVLLAVAREVGGALGLALPWDNEMAYIREAVTNLGLGGRGSVLASDPETFFLQWRQFGGWWGTDEGLPEVNPSAPSAAAPGPGLPEAGRPFRLQIYPHLLLAEGRHANKPWCQEAPDPTTTITWTSWIEIHPETAEELEIETGDVLLVSSEVGAVEVPAYVYPGADPAMVAMPLGQGHRAYGRYASDRGVNTADLLESVLIEGAGELAWGATWVSIEKTGGHVVLPRLEQSDSTILPTGIGAGERPEHE